MDMSTALMDLMNSTVPILVCLLISLVLINNAFMRHGVVMVKIDLISILQFNLYYLFQGKRIASMAVMKITNFVRNLLVLPIDFAVQMESVFRKYVSVMVSTIVVMDQMKILLFVKSSNGNVSPGRI